MDFQALESAVGAEIADAVTFIDSDLGQQRALATRYYRGDLFGNEEEGRSQVVSRDVADTVGCILPSLMRIFFGPENVVEFVPQSSDDIEAAQQASDYVNYIFTRDNPGFQILYAAGKDSLIRKTGIVKYWWDESEEVRTAEYSGLDEIALTKLLQDAQAAQKVELVSSDQTEDGLSVTLKLTKRKDRVVVCALPPEEFLIDRRARSIDEATFAAHRCMKSVSDLVAMGYDKDEIEAVSQDADDMQFNQEAQARNPYTTVWGSVATQDPTMKLVLYVEGYLRTDVDGDGIAELVKVCTVGPNYKLLHHEAVEDRPFADFPCDPEPHTFFGYSIADKTMDIQRSKSFILRSAFDGLALSLNPRTGIIEGQVNMDDVLNTEVGAIIRMKQANALMPIPMQDTSGSAFQALTYMDEVKESRTGMSKVSQGLNPDTLQNMTATASAAQFTQSQQHIEMIARIWAETGMKKLFRGILKLVVENQRQERMVQLRKKWVPVDPRAWKVDMDVVCNVALGAGTTQEKGQLLNLIAGKQEQIILHGGVNNPLCGPAQLYETYSQLLQIGGFKNPDAFFKDPSQPDPSAQPQQPPQPSPEAMKAQADAQQAQAKLQQDGQRLQLDAKTQQDKNQTDQARLQLEASSRAQDQRLAEARFRADTALAAQKLQQDGALAEKKLATEAALKLAEINSSHGAAIQVADIKAKTDEFRIHADLAIQAAESRDAQMMDDDGAAE